MDKELAGRLVYLTVHADVWYREINPKFNIPMANRIAKVVKVFDWSTDEGKFLLEERAKTGKWTKLDPKAFKFVLKIYCPELSIKNKIGFTVEEVMPRKYPGTELSMFELFPLWLLEDLQKEEKEIFKLERGTQNPDKKSKSKSSANVSKRIRKKSD